MIQTKIAYKPIIGILLSTKTNQSLKIESCKKQKQNPQHNNTKIFIYINQYHIAIYGKIIVSTQKQNNALKRHNKAKHIDLFSVLFHVHITNP